MGIKQQDIDRARVAGNKVLKFLGELWPSLKPHIPKTSKRVMPARKQHGRKT